MAEVVIRHFPLAWLKGIIRALVHKPEYLRVYLVCSWLPWAPGLGVGLGGWLAVRLWVKLCQQ